MELLLMQFRRVPCYLLLSGPNIISPLYTGTTADLYSFVDMRSHVSHSNTPGKFMIPNISVSILLDSKWEVKSLWTQR
jgi:hypothetical protein